MQTYEELGLRHLFQFFFSLNKDRHWRMYLQFSIHLQKQTDALFQRLFNFLFLNKKGVVCE